MSLLKRKPIYKLSVFHSIGESSTTSTFYFSTKNEIKLFLRNSPASVSKCVLFKQYVNYENNDLSTTTETVNTELENIKYVWYTINIGTSSSQIEIFRFKTLFEVKAFLSKYTSRLIIDLKYYVDEYTRYFDKDDDYKIKQTFTRLTDI